jgi:glucan-binding YG repeat protein
MKTRKSWKVIIGLLMVMAALLGICAVAGAERDYNAARSMLAMINDFRTGADAWYWESDNTTVHYENGLKPLQYDADLEKVAMLRAEEQAAQIGHTRPDGSAWSTAYPAGRYSKGENLAIGYETAAEAFEGLQETNENYAGQGHRRNMLRSAFTRVGIGCVTVNGRTYWAQALASGAVGSTPYTGPEYEESSGQSTAVSEVKVGWNLIDGKYYYYRGDDVWATRWLQDGGSWYYLDGTGAMQTGWKAIDGEWYYFKASGEMVTGWLELEKKWYYLDDNDGCMVKNWLKKNGTWYCFSKDGVMYTGWFQKDGNWYYASSSGAMQTGWKEIGGAWYYFRNDGSMVTGETTIGGQRESFNASGVWQGSVIEDYETALGIHPFIQFIYNVIHAIQNLLNFFR